MNTYRLLAPLFTLSAFAFLLFGVDAWTKVPTKGNRRISFWITLVGVIAAMVAIYPPLEEGSIFARQMLIWDGLSYFFTWVTLITVVLVILLSEQFADFDGLRLSTYYGLLLLSAAGLIFLVSANDFIMIFLGIELFAVPSFILAGYLRHQQQSTEAAMKLFIIGAFSSAMLIYGIALLYGITGSTSLTQLQAQHELLARMAPLGLLAMLFIIISFGFKIALVPFHVWVPDVFEGAPKPITALLSVAPKVAGAAVALRVFNLILPEPGSTYLLVFAILSALSMTLGNIIGLQQTHIVRLLAYSSIAHMGYLLLGLVSGDALGMTGVYLYAGTYLFMNLGAFAVVICLSKSLGSDELSAYAGLGKRSPGIAALLAFFLISLTGVPPTAGFIAKYYVFQAAFQSGWLWLVLLAAVNSVISAAYYFRIIRWMYFQEPASEQPLPPLGSRERLVLAATSFFTLSVGLAPQFFIGTVQAFLVVPKP
jgi:NADH-quinone oxidoreductase subunit N